jgi:hypothetical protein
MTRSLLALPVRVAALVAAGCGESEEAAVEDNPLAALDAAAKRTDDVESLRQTISMESDLDGEKLTMEGEGSFTADAEDGVMTASMVADGDAIDFELVSVDGTIYMKSDDLPLPEGKEWFKTPDAPTSTMQPAEFVQFLRESEGVENVGTEEIRGELTTHFRGPLDLMKLAEASDNDVLEQLKQTPEAKDFDIFVDVWVMENDLPARIAMNISAPKQTTGEMTMSTDILEYDVPVDAEAPPKDKVAENLGAGSSS